MKKTFLFFFCTLLCISLKSMNTYNNLACVPPELIINYMFPDDKNVDYEFTKLVNIYDTRNPEQAQEHNAILNKYIKPLVNLSMTSKGLRTDPLLEEIKKRFNVQHASVNSIYKYKKSNLFKNSSYHYYQIRFKNIDFIKICSLTKNDAVLGGYYQMWGINYKPILLIKTYSLDVHLIKYRAQNFTFTDDSLYESFYHFTEEIGRNLDDLVICTLCTALRPVCLDKKTIPIELIKLFLDHLSNERMNNTKNYGQYTLYLKKALEFLNLGKIHCPINLCFEFKFLDTEKIDSETQHKILDTLDNKFKKENQFDNDLFFDYIEKNFNDDLENTGQIVSQCKKLLLKCNKVLTEEGYCINFEIQNNNGISATSDEPIIPLDLVHFE